MEPVKLGIIGCGIAARKLHWPALQKVGGRFKIEMVCNHTEKKAQSYAELVGKVPYVLDYHDLLANPTLRYTMGKSARVAAELNYRLDAVAEQTKQVYRSLLVQAGSPPATQSRPSRRSAP